MPKEFIQRVIKQAGKITLEYFKKATVQYTKKHALDVVTEADLAANKFIVDSIKKEFPNDGIISEEIPEYNSKSEFVWIIDPVDGTLNFSKGIPIYCVMIARAHNGVLTMAAIYDPVHNDLYVATKGEGAYVNDAKIQCSNCSTLEESVGSFNASIRERNLDISRKLMNATSEKKVFSTALFCVGMGSAYVAAGKRDWAISHAITVWDNAAPVLLMQEAGCKVTNYEGHPWKLTDKSYVAANPILHEKLMKALHS